MLNLKQIPIFTGLIVTAILTTMQPASAQKVCIVTDTGKAECGRVQENFTPRKSQTLEFEDLNLTLLGCKRYPNNQLKCNFFVKAKQDGYLLFGYGKFFDAIGGVHSCSSSKIGAGVNPAFCDDIFALSESLKNIPLRAELTFDKIPDQVKEIAALQLFVKFQISGNNKRGDKAIFRDVPIE